MRDDDWLSNSDRQQLLNILNRVDTQSLYRLVSSLPEGMRPDQEWEELKTQLSTRMAQATREQEHVALPKVKARAIRDSERKPPSSGPEQSALVSNPGAIPKLKQRTRNGGNWMAEATQGQNYSFEQSGKPKQEREANPRPGTHAPFKIVAPTLQTARKKREWEHEANTGIDEDSGVSGNDATDFGI